MDLEAGCQQPMLLEVWAQLRNHKGMVLQMSRDRLWEELALCLLGLSHFASSFSPVPSTLPVSLLEPACSHLPSGPLTWDVFFDTLSPTHSSRPSQNLPEAPLFFQSVEPERRLGWGWGSSQSSMGDTSGEELSLWSRASYRHEEEPEWRES